MVCSHVHKCTRTLSDKERHVDILCGTVHMIKYTLVHTHTHAQNMFLTALVKGDRLM